MTTDPEPTWLRDQIEAAERERDPLLTMAEISNQIHAPDVKERLNARLNAVFDRWEDAGYPHCVHLGTPQPAVLLIRGDGRALCMECLELYLQSIEGTPEDRICDFCEREVDPIAPFSAPEGPITYMGGICRHCRGAER